MKTTRLVYSISLLLFALASTGCGGGGGTSAPTVPDEPTPVEIGEQTNPIPLTYPGNFPHSNSLAVTAVGKYFKISGLTPGQDYKLTISTSYSLRINVYDYADYTSRNCQSSSYCVIGGNSDGQAYVEVERTYTSGTATSYPFTLSISGTNFEGSISAPVDITAAMPYSNTIPAATSGYYTLSGLTPGNQYTFRLLLPSDSDSDLYIYQDQFTALACDSTYTTNGSDEYCTLTAATDTLRIKVRANEGGAFELTMTDNGPGRTYVSEGSIGSEVELVLDTSHGGGVDYTTPSYYHIGGLDPAKQYRTVLSSIWYEDNVDLYVYSDSSYSTLLCSSVAVEPKDEVCRSGPSATGELWIRVDGSVAHNELGQLYDIEVRPYYPNEGTYSEPLQLTYGAGEPLHSGTVDTYSYYRVNGLVAGQSYVVNMSVTAGSLTDFMVDGAHPISYFTADCELDLYWGDQSALSCIAEARADGTLGVRTANDWSYSGAAYDISVALSPHQSEGGNDAPVSLALGTEQLPHSGSIGGAPSYYVVTGVTPDQAYTISLNGLPGHGLIVYTSSFDTATSWACSESYPDSSGYSQCTVRAVGNSLWVKVSDNSVGGTYTLDAIHAPYQSEGSSATPVQIAMAVDPRQGVSRESTVSIDASYYQITGLTAGQTYAIAVDNIDSSYNHSMTVYNQEPAFGDTYACREYNISSYWGDAYCLVTAASSSLWLMVEGDSSSTGASYDITARLKPLTEAENLDFAVAGTFPRLSSVGLTDSVYTIRNLTPNELYDVTLSNMTDDVDIPNCATSDGLVDELCVRAADANGEIVVNVSRSKTLYGAYFNLGVTAGNVNEGNADVPHVLAFPTDFDPSYSGQVGTGTSVYKVTGLTADTLYEVRQTNLTASAGLTIYTDGTLVSTQCKLYTSSADKLCGGTSTVAGELYIAVPAGYAVLGANFNLDVVQGLAHEGSSGGGEVVLTYGTTELPYHGTVDKSASYYQLDGLATKTQYYVVLKNQTEKVTLRVFPDNSYSGSWLCDGSGTVVSECVAATGNNTTSLFIRVEGDQTVAGAEYDLEVLPIPVSEGTSSVPVAIAFGTDTPYDGQVASAVSGAEYSYYRLDGLTPGTTYTVSMETYPELATLYVYTSSEDLVADTTPACQVNGYTVGEPQVCNVASTGSSLWVKIGNYWSSIRTGTFFTLHAAQQ